MSVNEEGREGCIYVHRSYQEEILWKARERNTIVYLPPGTGKTFVAATLIKSVAQVPKKRLEDGGQRTFFLVNAPLLLEQRKERLRRCTRLAVGPWADDTCECTWRESAWKKAFDVHQVMVLELKVFVRILKNYYIQFKNVNLIIIDECHAAEKTTITKLMDMYDRCLFLQRPRILGLTATLLSSAVAHYRIPRFVTKLERKLMSSFAIISNIKEIERFLSSPDEKHVPYDEPVRFACLEDIKRRMKYILDVVIGCERDKAVNDPPFFDESFLYKDIDLSKRLVRNLVELSYNIEKLGIYGGNIAALKLMMFIQRLGAKSTNRKEIMVYLTFIKILHTVSEILIKKMENVCEIAKIYEYSSPQVTTLLDLLREYKIGNNRCIIFVERCSTAEVLSNILKAVSRNIDDMRVLKADFVAGLGLDLQSSASPMLDADIQQMMYPTEGNWISLEKFKKGDTNVLVTTDIVNDGLDAPECKLVVRFDLPKIYRSHILSKAWASRKSSYYVLMTPRKHKREIWNKMIEYRSIENCLKSVLAGEYPPW